MPSPDNPKQIYHCDFPECHRSFVRQDLCARHKERHTARGSQLLRKDTFMHNINPIVTAAMAPKTAAAKLGKAQNSPTVRYIKCGNSRNLLIPPTDPARAIGKDFHGPISCLCWSQLCHRRFRGFSTLGPNPTFSGFRYCNEASTKPIA